MKRKRIEKVGKRAKRVSFEVKIFRLETLLKASGRCELCGWPSIELDAHHIVPKSRCADWPRVHDASINGMAVDRECHDKLTLDPKLAGKRYQRAYAAWRRWRSGA